MGEIFGRKHLGRYFWCDCVELYVPVLDTGTYIRAELSYLDGGGTAEHLFSSAWLI